MFLITCVLETQLPLLPGDFLELGSELYQSEGSKD